MEIQDVLRYWAVAEELFHVGCVLEAFATLHSLLRGGAIPPFRRRMDLSTRVRAAEMILLGEQLAPWPQPHAGSRTPVKRPRMEERDGGTPRAPPSPELARRVLQPLVRRPKEVFADVVTLIGPAEEEQECEARSGAQAPPRGVHHRRGDGDGGGVHLSDGGTVPLALAVKAYTLLAIACRRRRQYTYALELLAAGEALIGDVEARERASSPASVVAALERRCCRALVATEMGRTLYTVAMANMESHELGQPMRHAGLAPSDASLGAAPADHAGNAGRHSARHHPIDVVAAAAVPPRTRSPMGPLVVSHGMALHELSARARRYLDECVCAADHDPNPTSRVALAPAPAVSSLCFARSPGTAAAFLRHTCVALTVMCAVAQLLLRGHQHRGVDECIARCERLCGQVPELALLRFCICVGFSDGAAQRGALSLLPSLSSGVAESWLSPGTRRVAEQLVSLVRARAPSATGSGPHDEELPDPRDTPRLEAAMEQFRRMVHDVDREVAHRCLAVGHSSDGNVSRSWGRSVDPPPPSGAGAPAPPEEGRDATRGGTGEGHEAGDFSMGPEHAVCVATHSAELRFLVAARCAACVEVIIVCISSLRLRDALVELLLLQRFASRFPRQSSAFLCTIHTLTAELAMLLSVRRIPPATPSDVGDGTREPSPAVEPHTLSPSDLRNAFMGDLQRLKRDYQPQRRVERPEVVVGHPQTVLEFDVGIAYRHLCLAEVSTSDPALLLRTKLAKCLALLRASQWDGHSISAQQRDRCSAHAAELLHILKSNHDEFVRVGTGATPAGGPVGPSTGQQVDGRIGDAPEILSDDQLRATVAWTAGNRSLLLMLMGAITLSDSHDEFGAVQYLKAATSVARSCCGMISPTVAEGLLQIYLAHSRTSVGSAEEARRAIALAMQVSARCEHWSCFAHCVQAQIDDHRPGGVTAGARGSEGVAAADSSSFPTAADAQKAECVLRRWRDDVRAIHAAMAGEVREALLFRVAV